MAYNLFRAWVSLFSGGPAAAVAKVVHEICIHPLINTDVLKLDCNLTDVIRNPLLYLYPVLAIGSYIKQIHLDASPHHECVVLQSIDLAYNSKPHASLPLLPNGFCWLRWLHSVQCISIIVRNIEPGVAGIVRTMAQWFLITANPHFDQVASIGNRWSINNDG